MDERNDVAAVAQDWVSRLNAALAHGSVDRIADVFQDDAHWRNAFGLGWDLRTISGSAAIARELGAVGAPALRLHPGKPAPERTSVAGIDVILAFLSFDAAAGDGVGVVRLQAAPDGHRALSLMTTRETLATGPAAGHAFGADYQVADNRQPNWLDKRREEQAFADRDPDVLIVGGGHAGMACAAELKLLGLDALIVDQQERIGDNWRTRYHSLLLHNKTPINHLPHLPFPKTFPDFLPKDKVANWIEHYAEIMELNYWVRTSFLGAEYDAGKGVWRARLKLADGGARDMSVRHVVLATSVSGSPKIPNVPTLSSFKGEVVHSSGHAGGAGFAGRKVLVLGTGSSAHDIAQDLCLNGAHVTMVQRSPTMIVNVEPSAQLYDQLYLNDGPALEDRDLINLSTPLPLVKKSHQIITRQVKELDADLYRRLEAVGFRLSFGDDDAGWPLLFRTRGGGYYFNAGCSELIADGKIKLIQNADIARFDATGVRMQDGAHLDVDRVILATGFMGHEHLVGQLFGRAVADRVGQIWGIDPDSSELRNMWMRTHQPGLWFTGGSFSQCRIYSKYLAMQIAAIEAGLLSKELTEPQKRAAPREAALA